MQTIEDRMRERLHKHHLDRLQAIRDRKNIIPGPCEARRAMRIIEQEHLHAQERRLKVSQVLLQQFEAADIMPAPVNGQKLTYSLWLL